MHFRLVEQVCNVCGFMLKYLNILWFYVDQRTYSLLNNVFGGQCVNTIHFIYGHCTVFFSPIENQNLFMKIIKVTTQLYNEHISTRIFGAYKIRSIKKQQSFHSPCK